MPPSYPKTQAWFWLVICAQLTYAMGNLKHDCDWTKPVITFKILPNSPKSWIRPPNTHSSAMKNKNEKKGVLNRSFWVSETIPKTNKNSWHLHLHCPHLLHVLRICNWLIQQWTISLMFLALSNHHTLGNLCNREKRAFVSRIFIEELAICCLRTVHSHSASRFLVCPT